MGQRPLGFIDYFPAAATSFNAGSDFFPALAPRESFSALRISIILNTAAVVQTVRSNGTRTVTGKLNDGVAMGAGREYTVTVPGRRKLGTADATFSLRGVTTCKVDSIFIEEVIGEVD